MNMNISLHLISDAKNVFQFFLGELCSLYFEHDKHAKSFAIGYWTC
jgi:hypothetical protein